MEKDKSNINDDRLDELLRRSFLEGENDPLKEDLSKVVYGSDYNVNIDPAKEKKFLKRFSAGKGAGNGPFYWMAVIIAVTITVIVLIVVNDQSQENKTLADTDTTSVSKEDTIHPTQNADNTIRYGSLNEAGNRKIEISTAINDEIRSILTLPSATPLSVKKQAPVTNNNRDDVFELNPDVINRYWFIKRMMIEKLLDTDKGLYEPVPEGSVVYKGEPTGIKSFFMRRSVVTNLEYRTFLVDLLVQGKKDEYDKAKVKQDIWNNYKMPELAERYFKDEDYNDFPVVNISPEGARMFCEWLENEAKLYAKTIKKSYDDFSLQLPTDAEWMSLVYYGYLLIPSGDFYLTIFDSKEGYIDKSMEKRVRSLQKSYKMKDEKDKLYATSRYGMTQQEVLAIFDKAWQLRSPEPLDTILPERMKDYGLIGHVSEITVECKSGKSIVYGTTWSSKEEFTEMLNDYTKNGGSPFVGMRYVRINENAAEYKNPFW